MRQEENDFENHCAMCIFDKNWRVRSVVHAEVNSRKDGASIVAKRPISLVRSTGLVG